LFLKPETTNKTLGEDHLKQAEKFVSLSTYDELWMRHLDNVEGLRDGISLRGYAQKDPVVEYKKEAYALFETLLGRIDDLIARRIFRVQIATRRQPVTDMVTNKNGQKQEEKKVPSKKDLKRKQRKTRSQ